MRLILKDGTIINFTTSEELVIEIAKILKKNNYSDRKISRKTKKQHSTITRILTGQTKNPGLNTVVSMLKAI
ncbi:MAG: hypothetical protein ACRCXT_16445 [Paraclostridium sp.]